MAKKKISWSEVTIPAHRGLATRAARARAALAWKENPGTVLGVTESGDLVTANEVDFAGCAEVSKSRSGSSVRGPSQAKSVSIYLEEADRMWLDAAAVKAGTNRSAVLAGLIAAARVGQ